MVFSEVVGLAVDSQSEAELGRGRLFERLAEGEFSMSAAGARLSVRAKSCGVASGVGGR